MKRMRKSFWFRLSALIVLCNFALLTGGCACKMMINTDPQGADVFVEGEPIGKSPATWTGKSGLPGKKVLVEAKKEGYQDATKLVDRDDLNTGYAVMSFLFLFLGFLWSWEYPDSVYLHLEPEESAE